MAGNKAIRIWHCYSIRFTRQIASSSYARLAMASW